MGKLYKFPNNAIPISNGLKVMSFNVRLFNSFKWIDSKSVPESIESFISNENLIWFVYKSSRWSSAQNLKTIPINTLPLQK